jgi:hypothetical protein
MDPDGSPPDGHGPHIHHRALPDPNAAAADLNHHRGQARPHRPRHPPRPSSAPPRDRSAPRHPGPPGRRLEGVPERRLPAELPTSTPRPKDIRWNRECRYCRASTTPDTVVRLLPGLGSCGSALPNLALGGLGGQERRLRRRLPGLRAAPSAPSSAEQVRQGPGQARSGLNHCGTMSGMPLRVWPRRRSASWSA